MAGMLDGPTWGANRSSGIPHRRQPCPCVAVATWAKEELKCMQSLEIVAKSSEAAAHASAQDVARLNDYLSSVNLLRGQWRLASSLMRSQPRHAPVRHCCVLTPGRQFFMVAVVQASGGAPFFGCA